jgi:LysM repeat protein
MDRYSLTSGRKYRYYFFETRKKVEFPVSCGNNSNTMTCRLIKLFMVLMSVTLSGCLTLVDDSTMGEQRADADTLKAEVYRLRDQVSEMRQSLSKLEEEMQSIQNSRGNEAKDSKNRLDEIERSLKTVESSHDQLKREIIDDLARKIEKLGGMTGASSGKSSGKSGSSRSEGKKTERGYEHVVKPGETLSEIATAYSVTPGIIIKANNLANPNSLRVGQKLFIPE